MPTIQWPSSREYVEAVQNPAFAFQDPDLKTSKAAIDRLGMPFVTSGQFAYVFKMTSGNGKAQAVRCFRGNFGDREDRYQRIDNHLNMVSAPYFASFEYDAQGIMVSGRRYPIQVMEWISGFPLDVYLHNVLKRPDVLKFLSDQWLKVLASLRDSKVSHGDLQHGNIIVDDSNSLRLVDLDGMYVPAMAGWKSSELGHRHYQHPKRGPNYFDETLDNFSGLVIYLSLLSLKEKPELWKEFHDENLIFTRDDFENPRGSKLFAKIRAIGPDHRRLADALDKACGADPARCPSALDLAGAAQSKLPAWMLQSPTVTVHQTTREVRPGDLPTRAAVATSAAPATVPVQPPQSAGMTSVSVPPVSSPITQPAATIASTPQMSAREVAGWAITYAFIGLLIIWLWVPLVRLLIVGLGASTETATRMAILSYLAVCVGLGYRKARKEAKPRTSTTIPLHSTPVRSTPALNPAPRPVPRSPVTSPSTIPTNPTPARQTILVGSRIRLIYHKPNCKWALKISYRNRIEFHTLAEATLAGYRACGVCSP
jgi:serine/threonine protein kinase